MRIYIVIFLFIFLKPYVFGQPNVLIDAGHGGDDPGAIGTCINEDVLNLDEALNLFVEIEMDVFNPWFPYMNCTHKIRHKDKQLCDNYY